MGYEKVLSFRNVQSKGRFHPPNPFSFTEKPLRPLSSKPSGSEDGWFPCLTCASLWEFRRGGGRSLSDFCPGSFSHSEARTLSRLHLLQLPGCLWSMSSKKNRRRSNRSSGRGSPSPSTARSPAGASAACPEAGFAAATGTLTVINFLEKGESGWVGGRRRRGRHLRGRRPGVGPGGAALGRVGEAGV